MHIQELLADCMAYKSFKQIEWWSTRVLLFFLLSLLLFHTVSCLFKCKMPTILNSLLEQFINFLIFFLESLTYGHHFLNLDVVKEDFALLLPSWPSPKVSVIHIVGHTVTKCLDGFCIFVKQPRTWIGRCCLIMLKALSQDVSHSE